MYLHSLNAISLVPKLIHVTSGPARVGRYLIGEPSTQLVKLNEQMIVGNLDFLFGGTGSNIRSVVELRIIIFHSLHHVRAHNGVMSVRI